MSEINRTEKKPLVLTVTGLPGTGKTTIAEAVRNVAEQNDLLVTFLNDYPLLMMWAANKANISDGKVEWFTQDDGTQNFSINAEYYPELSLYIATCFATMIREDNNPADVYIIEAARGAGAGERRDRYDEHLLLPLIDNLRDLARFGNIEVVVESITVLFERMKKRVDSDPTAPPTFVLQKYLDDDGKPQSSLQQAKELQEAGVADLAVNDRVVNGESNQAEAVQFVTSVIARILTE